MSITELLQAVGDEHVVVQNLHESMESARIRDGDGQFTFWTDAGKVLDTTTPNPKYVGLILWLPSERIPKAEEEIR